MTSRAIGEDPRVSGADAPSGDVRPVVALPRRGLPTWALILFMGLAALLLFIVLDSRRRAAVAPAIQPSPSDRLATPAPPPPLVLSQAPPVAEPPLVQQPVVTAPPITGREVPPPQPRTVYVQQPMPSQQPIMEPPQPPAPISSEPALVMDTSAPRPTAAAAGGDEGQSGGAQASATPTIFGARARAGALANPSSTVPQGTLIPAVLETAIDSTRPGLARAIVSRDVRGFDGRRVLIPRGSRLIGEYRSDIQPGQRRALVNWTRLIRPDGTTIAIGSPAADPLGRGGINARVNTHFFERFAGAILQSALDIGVNLAASRAGSGSFFFLPGAAQASTSQIVPQRQISPTLTVRAATSISIFVARDLDFGEPRR